MNTPSVITSLQIADHVSMKFRLAFASHLHVGQVETTRWVGLHTINFNSARSANNNIEPRNIAVLFCLPQQQDKYCNNAMEERRKKDISQK